jgi:hypothetical protein
VVDEKTIIDAVLSGAARTAFAQIIASITQRSKKKQIDAALVEQRLIGRAKHVKSVKTLLSTDNPVPIDKFYCPPRLTSHNLSFVPHSSDDFREDHVLIEGIAGQGKSILLRALCVDAILNHGRIAFFFELRKTDESKPLITTILESLEELGLPRDMESLRYLTVAKGLEIYLDGFDEIDQKKQERIDREVEYLISNYRFLRIFASSRPHVNLSKNPSFWTYRIENLNQEDVSRLIEKLLPNETLAASLKAKLAFHKGRALDLLETPLLVTLLVAQYEQTQQIPEQLSEFYDSIFPVLFERHDSFKSPFQRPKHLKLTTHSYRKIFQQFCFFSLFLSSLVHDRTISMCKKACDSLIPGTDPEKFLQDVSEVSSLINEEGGEWSFIHNSVQEYYAAAFMLSGSDAELERYSKMFRGIRNASSRDQVFRFAREIDEFRFVKFVELPFLQDALDPLELNASIDDDDWCAWLAKHAHEVSRDDNLVDGGLFFTIWTLTPAARPFRFFANDSDADNVQEIISDRGTSVGEKVMALSRSRILRARMVKEVSGTLKPHIDSFAADRELIAAQEQEHRDISVFLNSLLAEGSTDAAANPKI